MSPALADAIARFLADHLILEVVGGERWSRVSNRHDGEYAGPCPVCGGTDRLSVYPSHPDGGRAVCRRCCAGGDALDWSVRIAGRDPRDSGTRAALLRERGYLTDSAGDGRPAPREAGQPAKPTRAIAKPVPRPDYNEIRALWDSAAPVTHSLDAMAWLRSRALDPDTIAARDVARVIAKPHPRVTLPRWARSNGEAWNVSGHRLIVPLHDATGAMRSVRARWIGLDGAPPNGAKAVSPAGYSIRGLVMRTNWPPSDRIVVSEGEPDFLTWAQSKHAAPTGTHTIIGIVAGSWDEVLARRVPDGAEIIVRTHHDEAGHRYAQEIAATLAMRCIVRRGEDPAITIARIRKQREGLQQTGGRA